MGGKETFTVCFTCCACEFPEASRQALMETAGWLDPNRQLIFTATLLSNSHVMAYDEHRLLAQYATWLSSGSAGSPSLCTAGMIATPVQKAQPVSLKKEMPLWDRFCTRFFLFAKNWSRGSAPCICALKTTKT